MAYTETGKHIQLRIEEMFTDLLEQKLYRTLPIGQVIASWFLRGDDLIWLYKEYQKMFDLFQDSPALQWMEESITAKITKKLTEELTEKFQKQVQAEQKKTRAEQQKSLAQQQQTVIKLVAQNFPGLIRLAREQVRMLKDPNHCQQAVLMLARANNVEEAQNMLLALSEIEKQEAGKEEEQKPEQEI
jgi:stress-induced morphogen